MSWWCNKVLRNTLQMRMFLYSVLNRIQSFHWNEIVWQSENWTSMLIVVRLRYTCEFTFRHIISRPESFCLTLYISFNVKHIDIKGKVVFISVIKGEEFFWLQKATLDLSSCGGYKPCCSKESWCHSIARSSFTNPALTSVRSRPLTPMQPVSSGDIFKQDVPVELWPGRQ